MARTKSAEHALDPVTSKALPQGVVYRGPNPCRAPMMFGDPRVTQMLETAIAATNWLEATRADIRRGQFVDRTALDRQTLREVVAGYISKHVQDGGRRGAAEDKGHTTAILRDDVISLSLSRVFPARVREFRDRQLKQGHAPATVVKRLNLLASILSHAISEDNLPLPTNPATAKAVKRPPGVDTKRDRRLQVISAAAAREAIARGEAPPPGAGKLGEPMGYLSNALRPGSGYAPRRDLRAPLGGHRQRPPGPALTRPRISLPAGRRSCQ